MSKSRTDSRGTALEHEMPTDVLKPIVIRNTEEKNGDFQFDTMLHGKPIQ